MPCFKIIGGIPLRGTVRVSGSKNAVLPMMAASILADGPVRLEGVPRLADVDTLSLVLGDLGVTVTPAPEDGLLLETVDPSPIRARYGLVRRMRASFCVLGPLLARRGRAVVPLPGGCNIGQRPVDLHLKGLAALGARLRLKRGYVVAEADRLCGTTIHLSGPRGSTVTGTANVLSAAVLARGITTITGAAMEPEIVDLGNFLNSMGAQIVGLGTSTIRIAGVKQLGGTTYRVIPDRIEAATLLLAGAITGGSATVTGVVAEHLGEVVEKLRAAGWQIELGRSHATITTRGGQQPMDITARPYPGIPTDVQAQWTALLCLAPGRSTVRDTVFPGRFLHIAELSRMGAQIEQRNSRALITGVKRLSGASVTASDLRASAALVLAALAAEGPTTVRQIHHLDRGYQRLDQKLGQLGASIERREPPDPRISGCLAEAGFASATRASLWCPVAPGHPTWDLGRPKSVHSNLELLR
jgi:UDP-N-acetylglucosamine 1-carboxyvinyltransferase